MADGHLSRYVVRDQVGHLALDLRVHEDVDGLPTFEAYALRWSVGGELVDVHYTHCPTLHGLTSTAAQQAASWHATYTDRVPLGSLPDSPCSGDALSWESHSLFSHSVTGGHGVETVALGDGVYDDAHLSYTQDELGRASLILQDTYVASGQPTDRTHSVATTWGAREYPVLFEVLEDPDGAGALPAAAALDGGGVIPFSVPVAMRVAG